MLEYPNSPIKRAGNKLSPGGRKVNIRNSANMILMNGLSLIHPPKIKRITIGVITADGKVNGLQGIKGHAHTLIRHRNLLHRGLGPQVIQDQPAITTRPKQYIMLRRVILDLKYGVDIPLQLINGLGPLIRPDLHNLPRSGEFHLRG